jgi:RimJ/RimL family protein N-acetyltransferase
VVRLVPVSQDLARAVFSGDLSVVDAVPGWPHADTFDALRPVAISGGEGTFLVVEEESGRVVGECGWFGPPDDAGEAEIGYGLAAPSRGRGHGTAAVAALLDWVERQPGVRRVTARVDVGNEPSHRLLARHGFERDGTDGDQVRWVRDNRTNGT